MTRELWALGAASGSTLPSSTNLTRRFWRSAITTSDNADHWAHHPGRTGTRTVACGRSAAARCQTPRSTSSKPARILRSSTSSVRPHSPLRWGKLGPSALRKRRHSSTDQATLTFSHADSSTLEYGSADPRGMTLTVTWPSSTAASGPRSHGYLHGSYSPWPDRRTSVGR